MGRLLTESLIQELLAIPKPLPQGWRKRLKLRDRENDQHKRCSLRIHVEDILFEIKCRQVIGNPLDFSIILVYADENSFEYNLIRCNGCHESLHTNRWEKRYGRGNYKFNSPCFHIHTATQRYQEDGFKIDGYAEETREYSSYETALDFFVMRYGFIDPDVTEMPLFDELPK